MSVSLLQHCRCILTLSLLAQDAGYEHEEGQGNTSAQSKSRNSLLVFSFEFSSADKGSEKRGPGRHPNCCTVIFPQRMRATRFSPSRQELLQELALQAEALQRVSHLLLEKNNISSTDSLYKLFLSACLHRGVLHWEVMLNIFLSPPAVPENQGGPAVLGGLCERQQRRRQQQQLPLPL